MYFEMVFLELSTRQVFPEPVTASYIVIYKFYLLIFRGLDDFQNLLLLEHWQLIHQILLILSVIHIM